MRWRLTRPTAPGWYWMEMSGELEIVKLYEYQVEPRVTAELEVAQVGRQHTAPVFDHKFTSARWFGPIAPPGEVEASAKSYE